MTEDENLETIDDGPRWTKREALHNKAIGYSFILCLYGVALAVVVSAVGYGQYYFHVLLAGFLPCALLLGYAFLHASVLKPRKVGKYVLKNKRLPDDMKQDN